MIKKLLYSTLLTLISLIGLSQGALINRTFENSTGKPLFNPILSPFGIQWSNSIKDTSGSLITVGYSSVPGNGQDVLLVKHNTAGVVTFSTTYNSSGSNNDYGIGLCEAPNGDFLVCGTTDNGGGNANYDIVVLRFNSSGTLLNSVIKNGRANKNDVAVDVVVAPNGKIVVIANTEGANNLSDFWLVKFSSTLTYITSNTYDFVGLNDFAIGLKHTNGSKIKVIGASASGTNTADYVVAVFNANNLNFMSETRNNLPGTALDQALAYCEDAAESIYITGKAWNGTNFDIKTVKIDSSFSIVWTNTLNPHGMDDAANSIAVHPTSGDVVIGGYATRANNFKEIICAKLSSGTGSLIGGLHNQSSENPSGDAFIKKIRIDATGSVFFVAGEKGISGYKQVIVGKIKANNSLAWQRKISNPSHDILPSDIISFSGSTSGVFAISIKDSTTKSYLMTGYAELELDTAIVSYGDAKYKDKEIIVRFTKCIKLFGNK